MTANQRSFLLRTFFLGTAMTLLVIVLDWGGFLTPIENQLYNLRARHCQRFVPPPTDKLLHVDIDDASLEAVGRWPWSRTVLGEVVEELNRAGAKVICLDVIMPEPEDPGYVPLKDGTFEKVDHDENLASAMKRHGHVLSPVSFVFESAQKALSPQQAAMTELLRANLAMTAEQARATLRGRFPDVAQATNFVRAREAAAAQRVTDELRRNRALTLEEMKRKVLPPAEAESDKGVAILVAREYQAERARQAVERFAIPAEGLQLKDVLRADAEMAVIPKLAEAAAYSGFVDHLPYGDGVVRSVPLWIEAHGKLYPQMGMATACAALGVAMEKVRVSERKIVIPKPDGSELTIPVHDYRSERLGRDVGFLMDVPWRGSRVWETMYDHPKYEEMFKQHFSALKVWEMARDRKTARHNNLEVDRALRIYFDLYKLEAPEQFFKKEVPDPSMIASRLEVARKTVAEIDGMKLLRDISTFKPEDLKPEEKDMLTSYDAMKRTIAQNERIAQREEELRGAIAGKTVFIGSISTAAHDIVTTPLHGACPGVMVHGLVFNSILTGDVVETWPAGVSWLFTLMIGLLVTAAVGLLSPAAALGVTVLLVAGYMGLNGFIFYDYGRHIVGMAAPVMAGGLVWGGMTLTRYIVERAERTRITSRFRSYVDEQLVDYVLENPGRDLFEGEEQELTVAFTDMQGFTTLMEKMGKGIVPILNEYMGRMVPVIQRNGGYVNKFLGDGIMFFYGAPRPREDHAERAVATVLEMQDAVASFNQWLHERGQEPVAVRAGVVTGFVIVGDAGPRKRSDYTVLGDSVNVSSRLEGANKQLGTRVLINQRTADLLKGEYLLRPIGRIQVVGKSEPVMAYEPLAKMNEATEKQKGLADVTRRIVEAFIARKFEECLKAIEEAHGKLGESTLLAIYARECGERIDNCPPDFDGRISLKEK